jgi:hypothetical protein
VPNPKPPIRPNNQPASSASQDLAGSVSAPSPSHTRHLPKPRQRVRKAPQESILLDPWLTSAPLPQGQPLASLLADLAPCLPKARADAAQRQLAVLSCLLANFAATITAHPIALGTTPPIAVPQGKLKATRYDNPTVTGRQLKPTLDALEAAGLIVRIAATFKKLRTTVQQTARLAKLMALHNVTTANIARLPDEEVIILRKRRVRTEQEEEDGDTFTANAEDGSLIDYPDDCQEANALRTELRSYNAFIAKADICIEGQDNPPPPRPFKRIFATSGPVQFNLHGRLYAGQVGGWHQGLPRAERHLVCVNGERVVSIDLTALHVMLACLHAHGSLPLDDPYSVPQLEAYRPAVKIVCAAMLSRTGELTKLPAKVREACPDLPKHWTGRRIARAIKEHLPQLEGVWGKDMGMKFMNIDATMSLTVLVRLMHEHGIPSLPLHDAILLPASAQQLGVRTMQEVSLAVVGVVLPLKVETYDDP